MGLPYEIARTQRRFAITILVRVYLRSRANRVAESEVCWALVRLAFGALCFHRQGSSLARCLYNVWLVFVKMAKS